MRKESENPKSVIFKGNCPELFQKYMTPSCEQGKEEEEEEEEGYCLKKR